MLQKDRSGHNAEGMALSHFLLPTSRGSDGFSSHQAVFRAGCGQDTKPMRSHLPFCQGARCEGQLWGAFSCRYVGVQVERHAKKKKTKHPQPAKQKRAFAFSIFSPTSQPVAAGSLHLLGFARHDKLSLSV